MDDKSRWSGVCSDITFERDDFEVLDLALQLIPELRLCALALKRARAAKLQYPIESVDALTGLLPNERFVGAGHHITSRDMRHYLPAEFFPIAHEGELVSRLYLALTRCKHELTLAASAWPEMVSRLNSPDLQETGA
jgi:hypothetical protein